MEKWHKKWPESLNRRYQKGMTPEAIISKYGLGWSVSFSTHSLISGIFAALCQQGDPITARSTLLAFTEIQHALYDSCVGRTIHGGEIFPLFSFATFQLNRWEQEKKLDLKKIWAFEPETELNYSCMEIDLGKKLRRLFEEIEKLLRSQLFLSDIQIYSRIDMKNWKF